jgi:hypothetical protein
MNAEEFATLVETALAKAHKADLAIEIQIEVFERMKRGAAGSRRCGHGFHRADK